MEKIELRVEQHAGVRLDKPWSAVFGLAGGTVGRSGQNKLILPDPESDVARVHAMVRLGTTEAYIANLCERQLIAVNGHEVGAGQEVPLPLGASVSIGHYQIRVCSLNQTADAAHVIEPLIATPASPVWSASHTESPALPSMAAVPVQAPAPLPSEASPETADSNPFDMFVLPETVLPDSAAPVAAEAAMPTAFKAPAPIQVSVPVPEAVEFPNAFDALSQPAVAAKARQADRALIIPADFNPFELVQRPRPKDEWGGLQAQGLSELAQQSHDGLIKTLPLSGPMEDTMDNPAHSGLPKQLDPTQTLDPLALFTQSSILASPELAEVSAGRSSELSHIFHLPKAAGGTALVTTAATSAQPSDPPAPGADPTALLAVQEVGLHRVQGLDLSLFGEAPTGSAAGLLVSPAATKVPDRSTALTQGLEAHQSAPSAPRATAETTAPAATTTSSTPAGLQAFGLELSGEPRSRTAVRATAQLAEPMLPSSGIAPEGSALQPLVAAFMEGAGLAPDRARLDLSPEFMRAFGEAFRVAIEGTIDLLAARAEIKQEFRAGVTIIGASANNPLKFLPNADGVIMQMIGHSFPGFMKPVPAIREAYADLRVHQLALMAGIRAAYSEALTRFDPLKMETTAPEAGLMDKLFGATRKAALWDEYKKNFSQLKNAAEDDLTAFSGQTFVQAYEQAANTAKGET